jgi:ABC-type multidrug transport system fused ATPase/permease subunit
MLNTTSSNSLRRTLQRSLRLLDPVEKRKLVIISLVQVALAAFDLIAIAIVGILGSLTITGISSRAPGTKVSSVLDFFHLNQLTFQQQVASLAGLAAILLTSKSVLSMYLNRRILYYLSSRSAILSTNLAARVFSQPLLNLSTRNSSEILYAITSGVTVIVLGVLATSLAMVADLALLVALCLGLFVVDWIMALSTILLFGGVGLLLYWFMHQKASRLGSFQARINVESNQKILEGLACYREITIKNRRSYYASEIGKLRFKLASSQAELSFMPSVGKYIMEGAIVIGAFLVSFSQFMLKDGQHAIATLAIFLAAGSRIAPAVLRIQTGAIQIKSGLGTATPTLDLIDEFNETILESDEIHPLELLHHGFVPEIALNDLFFTYPGGENYALSGVTLMIYPGEVVSIVGPSGAGKTTLIDVLLGVIEPDSGSVRISNLTPKEVNKQYPGAIGYVPQDVMVIDGSIRENIALGFAIQEASDENLIRPLDISQLGEWVRGLPNGNDSRTGERGAKISGGQRQRLGIARALFTQPRMIILDEATSSLDGQTEADVSDAINSLKGDVTVIMVAHRLSTVRNSDKVVYIDSGRILSIGTFDEVRNQVPDFDKQAALMGL